MSPERRIRAVFFDLYGTLSRIDPPREVIQSRAAAEVGLTLTKEGVDAGYALADVHMAEQTARAPLGQLSAEEQRRFFAGYEQLVLRGAGHDVDLKTAETVWAAVRRQKYGFALFDDVIPCLDALRSDGYVVAVLTNMDRDGDTLADGLGFRSHVEFTLTSREVGVGKPHLPMFAAALQRAGAAPGEAVHVGDQLDSDVEGALAAGLSAVLMDRYGNHAAYTNCPRITALAELPAVLAGL
ncbi:MAG: HAD family hydrolase [Dehalococcoidia bacterium]